MPASVHVMDGSICSDADARTLQDAKNENEQAVQVFAEDKAESAGSR